MSLSFPNFPLFLPGAAFSKKTAIHNMWYSLKVNAHHILLQKHEI